MPENVSVPPWADGSNRPLNAAIVGGGQGCESIIKMVERRALGAFRMRVIGVADVNNDSPGSCYAREAGIPLVTTDYRELYKLENLDLIIELTGLESVRDEIERTRPRHIALIDHFAARLFWELHQAEQAFIAQKIEMRERVAAEREFVAQIFESIPDEIVVVDTEMKVTGANTSFLKNNNLTIGEVRGCNCYELNQRVRGDCQVAVENCPFFNVMKDGRPYSLVRKHFDKEGRVLYAAIVGAPLLDRDGQAVGMIEMTRDITHRIRLEEELAASEVRLQQYMDLAPMAIWVKNRAGQYIDVNPAACTLFGKKEREMLGKTDSEIFPKEASKILRQGDRRIWQGKEPERSDLEVELGDRRLCLSTVKFPILDTDGKPTALCGLTDDVTAQKEAESELRETREYLQQVMDNSPVIIVTTNLDRKIVSFNRGAEESLGYSSAEVIGKPAAIFYHDATLRDQFMLQVEAGQDVRDHSTDLVCKDGSTLPVSLTLSQLKDSDGNMIGTVGMSKDTSHRKALMGQILQSERLAAVGRLASGVAHEINNPLAVISEIAGYLNDMLQADLGPGDLDFDSELRQGLPKIIKQVKRGRTITHRLLSFARKTEDRVEQAEVNKALEEILPFLEKQARRGLITIHRDYRENLPTVAVDEMQLQEIFINLITNAIHALDSQDSGNIWLSTRQEGSKVTITVRDDGPGIDESVRHRLFDPFISTKPTGQGTGLGLSICYGIVKRYDGEIRVESEPGQGTTFKVIFPQAKPDRQPAQDD